MDIQIIDVNTCKPATGVYLEIWSECLFVLDTIRKAELISLPGCNATGVYSGANAVPNGVGLGDLKNLNNSFQRGLQRTDDIDGAVQFDAIFPGHYETRAVHIHFMAHVNATVHPNGTIWNNKASHVGQGFFDMGLINLVKTKAPYSENRQMLVNNVADAILRQEALTTDPFFEYVLLGDDVTDGVLAWLRFGINATYERTVQAAAMRYGDGGKMKTDNPAGFMSEWFPGGFPTGYYATPTGGGGPPPGVTGTRTP